MTYKERIVLDSEEFSPNTLPMEELPLGKTALKTQTTLFTYEDGVTVSKSTKITGVNRHSNKRWFRWKTDYHYRFRIKELKNGNKYLFLNNGRTQREVSSLAILPLLFCEVFEDYVLPLCEELIRPYPKPKHFTSIRDMFFYYAKPAMVGKRTDDTFLAKKLGVSFRLNTPQEITKKVFKGRYRKDLVKALSNTNSYGRVWTCKLLSDGNPNIPTDWLIDYLNYNGAIYSDLTSTSLLGVPTQHLRKFLLCDNSHIVQDVLRMANENTDWSGSIQTIHDRLTAERNNRRIAQRRVLEEDFNKSFEYSEDISSKLEDLWTNHGLRIAESPTMLAEWGSYMSNCISSYKSEVQFGHTLLFGYYEDDKLIANLEIRNGRLQQLLGRFNQHVDEPLFYKLTDVLLESGLLKSNDFSQTWGMPAPAPEVSF